MSAPDTMERIKGEDNALDQQFHFWVEMRDFAQERLHQISERRAELLRKQTQILLAERGGAK